MIRATNGGSVLAFGKGHARLIVIPAPNFGLSKTAPYLPPHVVLGTPISNGQAG
jgi:hypothetical protein